MADPVAMPQRPPAARLSVPDPVFDDLFHCEIRTRAGISFA